MDLYAIRAGQEGDRDAVVELLTKIFRPIESFREEWVDGWREFWNRPTSKNWAFVATHMGRVVANLSFFKNNINRIRGNPMCFGGVWAVGTEQEHRRRGLLRGLFKQAFPMMNEQNIVLSILDPSPYQGAQIAYEKCGYSLVERRVKHDFLPSALRTPEGNPDITVRKLKRVEEQRIVADLEMSMSRYGSRIFTWPTAFEEGIKNRQLFLFERGSEPVGCAKYSIIATDDDSTLQVTMTYYKSYEVLPLIIGLIHEFSANAKNVEWICEPQIPVLAFVQNVHRFKTQSIGTMMLRIINFDGYCKSIQIPKSVEGVLVLKLTDSLCPWNEGVYQLNAHKGRLEVDRGDHEQEIELTLTPFQLSKVLGGLISPITLQELGIITCSPETARMLEVIFPTDSFLSYIRF
ncbi:MAG: enhanced intracellular survival protein Eis [Candidatus Hodarchaeota archaeon]